MSQVAGDECLQSAFCPFVETFQEGNGKCVPYVIVTGQVVDGITDVLSFIIIGVGIIAGGSFVSIVNSLIRVKLEGMNKTCYGHIFVFQP